MYLKKIKNPELFQGHKKIDKYFEGWYYKLVSKDKKTSIAFIPGISIHKKDPHTFIQVFISNEDTFKTHYFRFSSDQFTYSHDTFLVSIHQNQFTFNQIDINLSEPSLNIHGVIQFRNHQHLQKNILQPNIM